MLSPVKSAIVTGYSHLQLEVSEHRSSIKPRFLVWKPSWLPRMPSQSSPEPAGRSEQFSGYSIYHWGNLVFTTFT